MIQLSAAVFIVGVLIWVLGFIASSYGEAPYDILGLGLQGNEGLAIYVSIIATVVAIGVGIYFLIRSGAAWTRPVQRWVMRIPAIGHSLRILALSRIAWTLGLTLEAGMDVRRALPFSLKSTALDHFARHADAAAAVVNQGDDVFTAVARTGAFPADFLDALQVGEQSGRLDESMLKLADLYQDRARAAIATLTHIAGFAVWALVALMIVAILVRIVSQYAGFIQGLANPRGR
jgi:type II secretory pathway component PulF